jgi:hypothetical protein
VLVAAGLKRFWRSCKYVAYFVISFLCCYWILHWLFTRDPLLLDKATDALIWLGELLLHFSFEQFKSFIGTTVTFVTALLLANGTDAGSVDM